jgi:hypothetical protein
MIENFSKINWGQISKLRLVGIVFIVLLGILLVLTLVQSTLHKLQGVNQMNTIAMQGGIGSKNVMTKSIAPLSVEYEWGDASVYEETARIAPVPSSSYTVGDDAESFESLSYNVSFKRADIDTTCDTIESWKPLMYVVFETSSRNDVSCHYRFKVKREYVDTMLPEIEKLNPENFTANTETMKKQLVEYSDRLSILLRKQEILETSLENSSRAYSDLKALATSVEDVDSLTKIITNEIRDIGRLTEERILLSQEIERLSKNKSELEDSIDYVSFSLMVEKYDMFNLDAIKDSWVYKIRSFIYNGNMLLQNLTLGVLSLVLQLLMFVVYAGIILFIILFVGKHAWREGKAYWKR